MRVGIDSGPLTGEDAVRGVGTYAGELIEALKILRYKDIKIFGVDFKKADLSKYDLLHYPYFAPFFLTLPLSKKAKFVVTIHDLTPLIYPENYPPGLRGKLKFLVQKTLIRNASGVIAISETTKKDIVRFLGIPAQKIEVIYEAPAKIFRKLPHGSWKLQIKKKFNLPSHFVLYVGDVNYNKNIAGLADACKIGNFPLVMVGKRLKAKDFDASNVENRSFRDFLEKYATDPNVIRLGYLDGEDLLAVYNLATVYCQPSFYEGFGLPVLEAFSCGTPVVAAKTQALVEVGEEAALFADPKEPKDIAEKIGTLFSNSELRARLIREGWERAKDFSWEKAAKETINYYKKALEG